MLTTLGSNVAAASTIGVTRRDVALAGSADAEEIVALINNSANIE
jgi:hypothetical protein